MTFRRPIVPRVRLVDGVTVRREHVDFTMGCHWLKCKYIPRGWVWVEKNMTCIDRKATRLHELHEVEKMRHGWSYERAHASANRVELAWRKRHRKCSR